MRARRRKKTILLALTSTHHGFYRGAARYAAEHDWHVVADMIYDATIPVGWRGDGILSFVGHWEELAKYVVSARVPVVEISSVRKDLEIPCVMEDKEAIGRLGAEHLLERNFKNFAWAPFCDDAINEERFQGFAASVEANGFECVRLREGDRSILIGHYLFAERAEVRHAVERHELRLTGRTEWQELFRAAGLQTEYLAEDFSSRGLYVARAV
jgi:DNA-binding LacI/PurR family transcriptional regulator